MKEQGNKHNFTSIDPFPPQPLPLCFRFYVSSILTNYRFKQRVLPPVHRITLSRITEKTYLSLSDLEIKIE